MSTNFGNSGTPGAGFFFDHNGNSQFWNQFTSFPGGVVTDLYVYCAGDGATTSGQIVIWGSGGAILWQSGTITLPSGSESIGGQAWVHASVPSVYIAPQTLNLGFWAAGNVVWTFESGGGSVTFQHSVASAPTTLSAGGTESTGQLGAYITYTPGNISINTGTSGSPVWTAAGEPYVNTGTAGSPVWTPGLPQVNTGTAGSPVWTPGA
jgi:hypothetical protein